MSRNHLSRALLLACLALGTATCGANAQSAYSTEMAAGREAFDGSNFALAERHFDGAAQAAGSDGQKATALYSMAVALHRQGRIDDAKERVEEAIKLAPKNTQAQRLLEELNTAAAKPAPKGQKTAKAPAQSAADGRDPGSMDKATGKSSSARTQREEPAKATEPAKPQPKSAAAKEPASKDTASAEREKLSRAAKETAEAARERAPKEVAQASGRETGSIPAPKPKEVLPGKATVPTAAAPGQEPPAARAEAPKIERKKAEQTKAAEPRLDTSHLGTPEPGGARLLVTVAADTAPVLAAGFSRLDHQLTLITGPGHDGAQTSMELKRFDLATGRQGDVFALHTDIKGGLVAVPPSGALVLTAVPGPQKSGKTAIASIHLWDAQSVENTQAIEMDVPERGSSTVGVDRLVFSRNGKRVAVLHKTGVQLFETGSLRGVGSYRVSSKGDHQPAVALSASGNKVVLTNGTRLRLIDGSSIKDIGPASNKDTYTHVALSDAGTLIAAASGSRVRFIDASTGREHDALPETAGDISALAFSPGGDRIAVAAQDAVRVFTVAGRKPAVDLAMPGAVEHLSFSADGHLITAAGPKGTRVWSIDPAHLSASAAASVPAVTAPQPTVAAEPPKTKTEASVAPAATPASAEPASAAAAANVAGPATASPVAEPAKSSVPAPAEPPKAAESAPSESAKPAAASRRAQAALMAERRRAIAGGDCDRVKELDLELADAGQHDACLARADAARRRAETERNITDRRAALDAGDCDRVQTLDAAIGSDPQHAACVTKAGAAKSAAERTQRIAERQAAFDKLDCDGVKSFDAKLTDSTPMAPSCAFQVVLKGGSARELYLAAAKADADKDRTGAKQLYRALVDRFPSDDLALKAADRMTVIADQEAGETPATTASTRERSTKSGRNNRR